MNQTFEWIQKHLYCRKYQTVGGEWSTLYYGIFTDWQGIRRTFPIGDNLSDARDKLGELRTLNKGRYDWDAEKKRAEEQRRRAVTLSQWGATYFREQLSPKRLRPGSADREERAFALLERILGDVPLADIKKGKILEYR